MKFLSDMDTNAYNGKPMVEWEYAEGGRHWETFDSVEERDRAIVLNDIYNEAHKAQMEAHFREQDEWLAKMREEFGE